MIQSLETPRLFHVEHENQMSKDWSSGYPAISKYIKFEQIIQVTSRYAIGRKTDKTYKVKFKEIISK